MRRHVLFAVLLAAGPAAAQDDSTLDSIVVTGSRVTYEDLQGTPAVSITRSGDYLLQAIKLTNDSRDEQQRRRELNDTIGKLVAAGGSRIQVLHGDTYRVTLTPAHHDVEPVKGKREDTSEVELSLRRALDGPASQAAALAEEMREFARSAEMSGRTEIDLEGETGVGMNRPERYRYELIAAIAKDTAQVTEALALDCGIQLHDLSSRIEWERVSAGELLLYIPYTMIIESCRPRATP